MLHCLCACIRPNTHAYGHTSRIKQGNTIAHNYAEYKQADIVNGMQGLYIVISTALWAVQELVLSAVLVQTLCNLVFVYNWLSTIVGTDPLQHACCAQCFLYIYACHSYASIFICVLILILCMWWSHCNMGYTCNTTWHGIVKPGRTCVGPVLTESQLGVWWLRLQLIRSEDQLTKV